VGKQKRKKSLVFFVLMLYLVIGIPFCFAADVTDFSIRMLEGEQQNRFNTPVLVAGIWHYVNITINENVDILSLKLYKGSAPPAGGKNETNYYEWNYDNNNPSVWMDISSYAMTYIKPEFCSKTNGLVSFCIGMKDTMPNIVDYYENWTVEVLSATVPVSKFPVVVEKPETGISLSKPSSILFRVDPFTAMDAQGDNFFKIGNKGNIPLYLDYDSEQYNDVEIADIEKKVLPDETRTYYVTVHSKSWPPGFKRMNIELTGIYPQSYFVDTNATVTLQTSFIIDVPELVVYVGHSNYEIEEIQGTGIVFQYLEKLTMREGETRDITAYVSGNGLVTLEIQADENNLSVLHLYEGSSEIDSPYSFSSSNNSERRFLISVKALSEGTMGILTYQVTANDVTKTYSTQITIGPPLSTDTETGSPASLMQIVVIVIVLLVVIYMILSYIRNKKR
jgi:hypothetical protein